MKKRLLAIIATAAMVVTMIPSMVFAAGSDVATVNGVGYDDLQEAIEAAAPSGTVEIIDDVTVAEWVMFEKSLGNHPDVIDLEIDGLIINGNGHTVTINDIESAGNGDYLFYDATELNINNLTIKVADGLVGGIGMKSGVLNKVTFVGGKYGVMPGNGDVEIDNCTFDGTTGYAVYYESARDNLTVSDCTFDVADGAYSIGLRGKEEFKNNTINKGKTNIVSGSPVVEGNDFNDERLKVYNVATANISGNDISNLVFSEETSPANSTFVGNNLSDKAAGNLEEVGLENKPAPAPTPESAPTPEPTPEAKPAAKPDNSPKTGDNNMAPIAVAGLVMAAMAAVVATRRRTN